MATPIIYYGNAMLSGTLYGSNDSPSNPVARTRDGSVNLSYAITPSGSGTRIGETHLTLTVSATADALVFPRCDLQTDARIRCYCRAASGAAGDEQVNEVLTADTTFYLKELAYPTSGDLFWEVEVVGYSTTPLPQVVHEVVLAQKYTLPRSPEVSVTRTRVRQFTRLPIPGGQPFVKRDGPMLRRTSMSFVVLSGSEIDGLRGFVQAVEGGESFTLTDDLGDSYWAELLEADVPEQDEAGVSRVNLTFQEIKVE